MAKSEEKAVSFNNNGNRMKKYQSISERRNINEII